MNTQGKIRTLDELGALLDGARSAGKTIVQCHGVFDLLHIGHIRHLEAARRLGDVLIVTITADQYVNKGPHRPAFPEALRAEAVAALACVDFVALNPAPTAVELIRRFRPNVYVKGEVKGEGPRDHSDAILREEEAVKAAGGLVHYTTEATFSASALLNRYFDVFAPETRQFLSDFGARFSEGDILGYLDAARRLKVLVIGETIIDEYHFCTVVNKANKDPILAAKFLYAEKYAGGILAVANHLAAFCDHVTVLSALGSANAQEDFVRAQLNPALQARFVTKPGSPTIVKRRFLEEYMNVKLLEIDEMNEEPLPPQDDAAFCRLIEELAPQHDMVIVADYGHGLLSDRAIGTLCAKAPFLALNAQVNPNNYGFHFVSKYPRADFVVIDEMEARIEMRKDRLDLSDVAAGLARHMQCRQVLITRGQNGTMCYDAQTGSCRVPVFSTKLVDRIGAGDACLALTAPCAALGAPIEVVGFIGNLAGAAACAIIGNKTAIDAPSFFRSISSMLKQ